MSLGVDVDRTRFVQADASHNLLRTLSPNGKRSGKATGQLCPSLVLLAAPATIQPG